jgi:hypothetical protein
VADDILFSQMERTLQKHRRVNIPPTPDSPEELTRLLLIADNFSRYGEVNGTDFFSGVVQTAGDTHMIFVNHYVLEIVRQMQIVSVNIDATFGITPKMFYQTLIILIQWKERVSSSYTNCLVLTI